MVACLDKKTGKNLVGLGQYSKPDVEPGGLIETAIYPTQPKHTLPVSATEPIFLPIVRFRCGASESWHRLNVPSHTIAKYREF